MQYYNMDYNKLYCNRIIYTNYKHTMIDSTIEMTEDSAGAFSQSGRVLVISIWALRGVLA